jgi:hypothetical protein
MKRISIKVALVAAVTAASAMAFAAEPGQPAKPASTMQGSGGMPMQHGTMGSGGDMGGGDMGGGDMKGMKGMKGMMRSCQAMMCHDGMAGSAAMLKLPPGNEKLEFQMHAEMMQKMGEIATKYADIIKEGK